MIGSTTQGKTWRGSGTWIDGHVSSPAGCHSLCKGGFDGENHDDDGGIDYNHYICCLLGKPAFTESDVFLYIVQTALALI